MLVEMPVDVDVRVDPPGHDGQRAEVVVDRLRRGIDRRDRSVLDHQPRVVDDAAAPVERGAHGDDQPRVLCADGDKGRRERQRGGDERPCASGTPSAGPRLAGRPPRPLTAGIRSTITAVP